MKTKFINRALMGVAMLAVLLLNGCRKTSDNNGLSDAGTETNGLNFFQKQTEDKFVQNEILVKFKTGTSADLKGRALQSVGGTISEKVVTKAMENSGDTEGFYIVHV